MPLNIKIKGGRFNDIEGDLRVIDRSRHETNINSHNILGCEVTNSFNKPETFGSTGPPPSQPQSPFMQQQASAGGHIENRGMFNLVNANIDNALNDNSEHHYAGPAGPTNQGQRARPQKASAQTPTPEQKLVISHMQNIDQKMRQAFSKSDGQPRPLSEENGVPNMPRNNDDDGSYNNVPNNTPHVPSSSSGPTYRTIKGNLTKYDESKHETNISSNNVKFNKVKDSFNPLT